MKRALITGITGQDGSYLAELLLGKGYEVYGIIRRSSSFNTERIDPIYQGLHVTDAKLRLVYGDLNDASLLNKLIRTIQPDEIYNLEAQSHVRVSFDIPEYTAEVTGLGTIRLLEAIRESGVNTKFFQASSSEMFGKVLEVPQRESTPFYPRSSYGAAKVYDHWVTVNYREAYGLFACSGILFNHESTRRGETFVTSARGNRSRGRHRARSNWPRRSSGFFPGWTWRSSPSGRDSGAGKIATAPSHPGEGRPRRLHDARIHALGWTPKISLHDRVAATYRWYVEHRKE